MLISNNLLMARIEAYGIDSTLNEINSELIEDDFIKIIVRTAQHSKKALIDALEKKVAEQELAEESDQTIT